MAQTSSGKEDPDIIDYLDDILTVLQGVEKLLTDLVDAVGNMGTP